MRLYRVNPGRDENPRPGFDHWLSQWDSLRASRADCPKGEAQRAESIPPSPPYSKKEPELTLRLFCVYMPRPGRQVRFAYLPYAHQAQRCCRVGKRQRTHRLPRQPTVYRANRTAGALRLPALRTSSATEFVGRVSASAPTIYHAHRYRAIIYPRLIAARLMLPPAPRRAPSQSECFYMPECRSGYRGCPAAPAHWPPGNRHRPNRAPYR